MKRKRLFIILTILSIVILGIGGTFAYLTASATATNITQIKSGNLTMTIDGGGNTSATFMPSKCTSEYAIKKKIVATSSNTSGGKVSFSIGMNIATLSDDLKRSTMKYALTTSADSCSSGVVAIGNFNGKSAGDEVWLVKNDYDNITQTSNNYTKTYYLYIWLDEEETENIDGGNISVNMKGTSSNNPNLTTEADITLGDPGTLYYDIMSNADKTTVIDFSKTSEKSNTNGIYMTKDTDSGIPVYYYRGNVDNHLLFANFCWRIVRTTETGGLKLIYDGVPTDGQCNNTGSATTIGNSVFNSNYNSLADVGYMYGIRYTFKTKYISNLTGSIVFGNDITYANGTYTLKDTYTLTDANNWSSEYSTIASKYHYTCITSSDTCEKVDYIYKTSSSASYYFELSDGKNHLDILKEMLDNSTNENNSTIKTAIDEWYKNNMTDYTSQLEDTVFCNDRSYDISESALNKDYSNSSITLYFSSYQRIYSDYKPTLKCTNTNDKFTVETSNGNGALTYPVGLLTVDEMEYAGAVSDSNTSFYLYTGSYYWTLSPYYFANSAIWGFFLYPKGSLGIGAFYSLPSYGVRPSISLKQGTAISGGSGTAEDPFIVGQ